MGTQIRVVASDITFCMCCIWSSSTVSVENTESSGSRDNEVDSAICMLDITTALLMESDSMELEVCAGGVVVSNPSPPRPLPTLPTSGMCTRLGLVTA